MSVNGSSATGHCSNVSKNGVKSTCTDPSSSVLFDGVIPTLTGLDGDMWASQLLTLQKDTLGPTVTFDFTGTQDYVGLSGRLEVVMFNCPEKGISASTIRVLTSSPSVNPTPPLMVVNINITSCDSLVRVCTPIMTVQPSIYLQFPDSDMVYLAEVTFYAASSASTCPPDTIITTVPPDTIIIITTGSDTITSVIIPVVVVICVVFMIVGIIAAVLILWRYHKHKTSHHTALGEGHSHAHTHSHPPPVKMYEETGKVCYSSPPEALGQPSPSHDTYSHIQRNTSEGRGEAQSHQGGLNEEGGLSHENSLHVLGGGGEDSASQIYAQVDKKAIKKKKGTATEMPTLETYLNEERSGVHTPEASTHLYDGVDDKKKENDHPHTPEAGTTDQLYAQVDKKGKKKKSEMATCPHTPEVDTAIDLLYAQVDKKAKKKKGEVANTQEADTTVEQLYDNEKKEVPVCPP